MIKKSFKRILCLALALILFGMSTCILCSAGRNGHLERSYSESDLSEKKLTFRSEDNYYMFLCAYQDMLEYYGYGSSRDKCDGRHFCKTDLIWVYNFLKENIYSKHNLTDHLMLQNLLVCAEDSGIELP